jgi:hypothetical protein
VYQVLFKRFNLLLEKYNPVPSTQQQIFKSIRTINEDKMNPENYSDVLDSIFEKGLDEAMKKLNL